MTPNVISATSMASSHTSGVATKSPDADVRGVAERGQIEQPLWRVGQRAKQVQRDERDEHPPRHRCEAGKQTEQRDRDGDQQPHRGKLDGRRAEHRRQLARDVARRGAVRQAGRQRRRSSSRLPSPRSR